MKQKEFLLIKMTTDGQSLEIFQKVNLRASHLSNKYSWTYDGSRSLLRIYANTPLARHVEHTVVQFITESLMFFLPLVIAGIVVTLLLYFTGKKETPVEDENLMGNYLTILHIKINFYAVLYLLIWIVLITIGALSDFLIPTLISGTIALIPLIILLLLRQRQHTNDAQVR